MKDSKKASQCSTCKVGLDTNKNGACYSPSECSNYKPINNMKYRVGDKVRIKDIDWYNSKKDEYGHVIIQPCPFLEGMSYLCGSVVTISQCFSNLYKIKESTYSITDEMIDKLVNIIDIPDNMEFDKVEDGKIYLKEKKVELPKTWDECFGRYAFNHSLEYVSSTSKVTPYGINELPVDINKNALPKGYGKAILALCQLLICRDVYRQGWKPDYTDNREAKYCIIYECNELRKFDKFYENKVLSFQSAEVRDEFLENFKDLIEEAKELI